MQKIINPFSFSLLHFPTFFLSSYKSAHQILGISRYANQMEIKSAFYKLAKIYHPDQNSHASANAKFNIIKNAYQQMMTQKPSPNQRKRNEDKKQTFYNRKQEQQPEFTQQQQFEYKQFSRAFQEYMRQGYLRNKNRKYEKYFRQMFMDEEGFKRNSKFYSQQEEDNYNHKKGNLDIKKKININDFQIGTQKLITISKNVICSNCQGKTKNMKSMKCRHCKGKGYYESFEKCKQCRGTGRQKKSVCQSCRGKGLSNVTVSELVPIPIGLKNKDKIVIQGRGNQELKKGQFGDLIVQVILQRQSRQQSERKGPHSYGQFQISISQAVLGLITGVETVGGKKRLLIPSGVQDGEVLKILGGGYKQKHQNKKGDHYVKIKIDIPKRLTKEQKELFEKIKEKEQ